MSACRHILGGHLDSLFHQVINIQGNNEGIVGKRKDLTITGDLFKICMLLASISDVGEYDAVLEAIRGVSDEDGATNNRAVKNRLLGSFSEKHPGTGSIFGSKRIYNGHHKHGKSVRVTLARDNKESITCYNCGKNGHYTIDCRSKQNTKGKSSNSKGKPTKGKGSSTKSPKDSFMIMAAVTNNEEDPYESDHSKTTMMSRSQTMHLHLRWIHRSSSIRTLPKPLTVLS
jgi:Zinc knuckle